MIDSFILRYTVVMTLSVLALDCAIWNSLLFKNSTKQSDICYFVMLYLVLSCKSNVTRNNWSQTFSLFDFCTHFCEQILAPAFLHPIFQIFAPTFVILEKKLFKKCSFRFLVFENIFLFWNTFFLETRVKKKVQH